MRHKVAAALACLVVYCGGDWLWLGVVARDFYATRLGPLLRPEPSWLPAVLFYPLYVCGLMVFCVAPAVAAGSARRAVAMGAFFGLIAYATYDLSNLATLQGWPVTVTVADIGWGMFISALAALAGYKAAAAAR